MQPKTLFILFSHIKLDIFHFVVANKIQVHPAKNNIFFISTLPTVIYIIFPIVYLHLFITFNNNGMNDSIFGMNDSILSILLISLSGISGFLPVTIYSNISWSFSPQKQQMPYFEIRHLLHIKSQIIKRPRR